MSNVFHCNKLRPCFRVRIGLATSLHKRCPCGASRVHAPEPTSEFLIVTLARKCSGICHSGRDGNGVHAGFGTTAFATITRWTDGMIRREPCVGARVRPAKNAEEQIR